MTDKVPTHTAVKAARLSASLSQGAAAALVHVSRHSWQTYEAGTTQMKLGLWELFLFKTGQIWLKPVPVSVSRPRSKRSGRPENLTPFVAQHAKDM